MVIFTRRVHVHATHLCGQEPNSKNWVPPRKRKLRAHRHTAGQHTCRHHWRIIWGTAPAACSPGITPDANSGKSVPEYIWYTKSHCIEYVFRMCAHCCLRAATWQRQTKRRRWKWGQQSRGVGAGLGPRRGRLSRSPSARHCRRKCRCERRGPCSSRC
jgi:hypothetical protein